VGSVMCIRDTLKRAAGRINDLKGNGLFMVGLVVGLALLLLLGRTTKLSFLMGDKARSLLWEKAAMHQQKVANNAIADFFMLTIELWNKFTTP
jgi:hypothetical protein